MPHYCILSNLIPLPLPLLLFLLISFLFGLLFASACTSGIWASSQGDAYEHSRNPFCYARVLDVPFRQVVDLDVA